MEEDRETHANTRARLKHVLQLGSEMIGGLAAAGIGFAHPGMEGALIGGLAGPVISHTFEKVGTEISARLIGPREEKRVGAVLLYAVQKAQANTEAGKKIRDDGFFEEQIDGRSAADEIVEGTVFVCQREYQERKIPFFGNMLANIAFSCTVDRAYANLLLRTGERLSYRQLCLMHLVENYEALGIAHRTLRDRGDSATEAEIVALQELVDLDHQGLVMDADGTAWLGVSDATIRGSLTEIGRMLYHLMELSTLPISDVDETARVFRSS